MLTSRNFLLGAEIIESWDWGILSTSQHVMLNPEAATSASTPFSWESAKTSYKLPLDNPMVLRSSIHGRNAEISS
jgi:hypothetical protein